LLGWAPGLFLAKINETKALKNEIIVGSRGIQRRILLLLQLFIVAVLLNATFIVKKQIGFVFGKDLGFQEENVITFQLDQDLLEKNELLKARLLENPRIEAVSFSSGLIGDGFSKAPFSVEGQSELCYFFSIDPAYLDLYQIGLKYGRNFSYDRLSESGNTCLINEAAAKAFGIEDPEGKFIGDKAIIGVVQDFNFTSLHNWIEPLVLNFGTGDVVQLRIAPSDQEATMAFINRTCEELSPGFEFDYSFLDKRIQALYEPEISLKNSFVVYSIIALLTALLGLFGLTLFSIRKKTRALGIRKLYGAKLMDTFILFARGQLGIVLLANLLALPVSYMVMGRWLQNFPYMVEISWPIFFHTLLITVAFNAAAVLLLIIRVQRNKL
ncbi:MAG: hypothetical protein KDD04_10445, partial [Sinomicrobium sp.]|nr:hypothetical protein [Sinomicrobium sp.]